MRSFLKHCRQLIVEAHCTGAVVCPRLTRHCITLCSMIVIAVEASRLPINFLCEKRSFNENLIATDFRQAKRASSCGYFFQELVPRIKVPFKASHWCNALWCRSNVQSYYPAAGALLGNLEHKFHQRGEALVLHSFSNARRTFVAPIHMKPHHT